MDKSRISQILKTCCLPALLLMLWGCRTHPEMIRDARKNLALGNQEAVLKVFPREIDPADKNGLLYLSERSRFSHVMNRFRDSTADIIAVEEYERHEEESAAEIRLSSAGHQAAAVMTNDEALPYRLCDFERIMLYQTAGFNLLMNDSQSLPAAVANLAHLQERQRKNSKVRRESLEQQLAGMNKAENQRSLNMIQKNSLFRKHQADAEKVSGKIHSYENPYAYYFCGLYYERQGDYGSALIAYQMAYLLVPGNRCFRDSFMRMALQSGRKDLLAGSHLEKQAESLKPVPDSGGELIIFYEGGWIPARLPYKLSVPVYTSNGGFMLITLSFPYYPDSGMPAAVPGIAVDGRPQPTDEAANLHHYAIRQLRDQMPGIITRMFVRASARALAAYAANQAIDNIGDSSTRVLAQVTSVFVQAGMAEIEQPDLRSFLTLPHSLRVGRLALPAGKHEITVSSHGHTGKTSLDIRPGEKKILHILAAPEFLTLQSMTMPGLSELRTFSPVK